MHDSVSLIPELEAFIISMLEYKLHFKTFWSKKIIFALLMKMNKTEWHELGRSNFKSAVLKKKFKKRTSKKLFLGNSQIIRITQAPLGFHMTLTFDRSGWITVQKIRPKMLPTWGQLGTSKEPHKRAASKVFYEASILPYQSESYSKRL